MASPSGIVVGAAYIPLDRRLALVEGRQLPERTSGAALFADVSGITPLTEMLVRELGSRRGAEELTLHLNTLYSALIEQVHRYGGAVVNFAGDAITCWFDADNGLQATTCALALQRAMQPFAELQLRSGAMVALAIKVSVTVGPARRFLVGDPDIQVIDVLAGSTLDRMGIAGRYTEKHEVVVDAQTVERLGPDLQVTGWRTDPQTGERFAIVGQLHSPGRVVPQVAELALREAQVRPWVLPPVYARLQAGQEAFLAELRPAVSLFLGFSGLNYDGDPGVGEKLDAFVRGVQYVLAQHDSYLFQVLTGDKGSYLYAAFGAPQSYDDDPARAIAAAFALRGLPSGLHFISGVQIGVSMGQIRAGAYGSPARCTYGILGDEVNVAARLMSAAHPGQILISQHVAEGAARAYRSEYLDTIPLKGKRQPMQVFQPYGRQTATLGGWTPAQPAPLVGRDTEIRQIGGLLDAVVGGQGQILRLEGKAGVGKSRLAAHLTQMARDRDFQIAAGACPSTGGDELYAPWQQAFRALFSLSNDPAGRNLLSWVKSQVNHIQAVVEHGYPDMLPRLPLVGDLLNLPVPDNAVTSALDPRVRQQWLFTLAVELAQGRAATKPVLFLIEDAQWMDEASLGLALSLGWALADAAILLVLVQRPVEKPLLADLSRLSYHHALSLDELSPEGIAALVAHRLNGRVSPLALALIQARVQGNSFFAQELADALRSSGDLVQAGDEWTLSPAIVTKLRRAGCLRRSDGTWALVEDAPLSAVDLDVPASVHGVLLSRIDHLPNEAQMTLKVASVIGPVFDFTLLAHTHPGQVEHKALFEQLKLLETQDLLQQDMTLSGLVGAFRHTIVQEMIYGTLLEAQRQELHRAAGAALEQMQPDAVGKLAFHYSRGGARDKALVYLERAARKAQKDYANETALTWYAQALTLEERWEWRKAQVEILHILGQREEELAALQALEALPDAPVCEVAYLWGQYYEAIGEYAQAQAQIERALEAARVHKQHLTEARCLVQLGVVAIRQGDYDRAKTHYMRMAGFFKGRETFSEAENQVLMQALNGLGSIYRQQGQFDQAKAFYERALSLAQQRGDRVNEARALNNLGVVAFCQQHFAEAADYYHAALEIYRAIGDRAGEGTGLFNLALVTRGAGDYGPAQQHFSAALAIQQAIGNRWEEINIWNDLGNLYQELGDFGAARTCLQRGLALAQEIGDAAGEAYLLASLGLVIYEQGDPQAARTRLTQGLSLAETQHDRRLMTYFLSYLGLIDLHTGDLGRAATYAQSALALRQELNLRMLAADDLATLAALCLKGDRLNEALDYVRQVVEILRKCEGIGPEFPQRDSFICYQVLSAAGQPAAAREALCLAYDLIMSRADKIADAALRHSFLEQVAINRAVVLEYENVRRAA